MGYENILEFFKFILYCLFCFSGLGDGFFSSAFQSQLEGNSLNKAEVPQGMCV